MVTPDNGLSWQEAGPSGVSSNLEVAAMVSNGRFERAKKEAFAQGRADQVAYTPGHAGHTRQSEEWCAEDGGCPGCSNLYLDRELTSAQKEAVIAAYLAGEQSVISGSVVGEGVINPPRP